MPAFYKVDKERRLVMSTGSGVVTLADLLAHQEKLLADPDFSPDFSQLWDLAHVTNVELTNEELRKLRNGPFSRLRRAAPSWRVATSCLDCHACSRYFLKAQAKRECGC